MLPDELLEYLRLRDRGLRRQAFTELDRFLERSETLDFETRCRLAEDLLETEFPSPYPLVIRFLLPTYRRWRDINPKSAVAWRGLGILEEGPEGFDCLEQALELEPGDSRVRIKLAQKLVQGADYELHELPWFFLGSDPMETKTDLYRARDLLMETVNSEQVVSLREKIVDLESKLSEWLDSSG